MIQPTSRRHQGRLRSARSAASASSRSARLAKASIAFAVCARSATGPGREDARPSKSSVMLLQWPLIGAPGPKWLRLIMTVIGALAGSFAFTNFVILRLPHARRVF